MIEGLLKSDGQNRWRFFLENGQCLKLAPKQVVDVKIGDHWIVTKVEDYQDNIYPVVRGIRFYEGMPCRVMYVELAGFCE